jgi:tRNA(Ile)-lysidine synthase
VGIRQEFENDVARAWGELLPARAPADIVLAVSGGADSMAMLHATAASGVSERRGLRIYVAHLNHRLRGADSDADAHFVARRAVELGFPVYVGVDATLSGEQSNLEERARDARAAFLRRVAAATGASFVAFAHTLDDQAETVLHRIARGGGPGSIAGMERLRPDGWVRPLLGMRRAQCVAYLESRGAVWREDRSNLDRRYTRNRLRHDVLPRLGEELGVDIGQRLAALADDLRVEASLADRWIASVLDHPERDPAELPLGAMLDAGPGAGRLVHGWLAGLGIRPSRRQVDAIVAVAAGRNPSAGADLTGGRVERDYERLVWHRSVDGRAAPAPVSRVWRVPGSLALCSGWRLSAEEAGADGAFAAGDGGGGSSPAREGGRNRPSIEPVLVDAEGLGPVLAVRRPRPGDRIRLSGGRRKLSDVLIDRRVPRRVRSSLAVIARGDDIIWVPGIALDHRLEMAAGNVRILKLFATSLDCRPEGGVVAQTASWVHFG